MTSKVDADGWTLPFHGYQYKRVGDHKKAQTEYRLSICQYGTFVEAWVAQVRGSVANNNFQLWYWVENEQQFVPGGAPEISRCFRAADHDNPIAAAKAWCMQIAGGAK